MRPSALHEALLKAALCPPPEALAAFGSVRDRFDLDRLDVSAQRLLPLLARRLTEAGSTDPVLSKCRKVARFTWLRTNLLLSRTRPLVEAFQREGIPAMLCKGAAVIVQTGLPIALRPMDDLDLVVPREFAARAIDLSLEQGLSSSYPAGVARLKASYLDTVHALQLTHPSGAGIDLHWHLLALSLHRRADEEFWSRGRPAQIGGLEALVTCREDTLLHVLAHGAPWSEAPPARWVSDSFLLLTAGGEPLDEDVLVRTARRHRISQAVREALEYLREVFGAPVSLSLTKELARSRVPVWERVEHRFRLSLGTSAPVAATRAEGLALDFHAWVRRAVPPGQSPSFRDAVRFLEDEYGARTAMAAGAHALFVLMGRPWWLRRAVRALLRMDGCPAIKGTPVLPGEDIDFTSSGDAYPYLRFGWSLPEPDGLWTLGEEARLCLPLARPIQEDLAITASLSAFLARGRPNFEVDVVVGGRVAGTWAFTGDRMAVEDRRVVVPAALVFRKAALEITFVVRSPVSPLEARYNGDPRRLGLYLRSLRLGERPVPRQDLLSR